MLRNSIVEIFYLNKKVLATTTILILFCSPIFAQGFLNGSFEINTAGVDQWNLSNLYYNYTMSNSVAFGTDGNMDIITSSTYGPPEDGNWYVALTGGGDDAMSLTLSNQLISGHQYTISFYDRWVNIPNKKGQPTRSYPVKIGLSTDSAAFGSTLYIGPNPIENTWSRRVFSFIAPFNAKFITVEIQGGSDSTSWINVDNFKFVCKKPNLGNDTNLCAGSSIQLKAVIPFYNIHWQNNSTDSIQNVFNSGTYWVRANEDNICITGDTIKINYEPYPQISLSYRDTVICSNKNSGRIFASNLNPNQPIQYLWKQGNTSNSIKFDTIGTYTVWAKNDIGCLTVDSILIPQADNLVIPTINIPNQACANSIVNLSANGGNQYHWVSKNTLLYPDSNSTTSVIGEKGSAMFTVSISKGNCTIIDSGSIAILSQPNIIHSNDSLIKMGSPTQLFANGGIKYEWNPSNGLSCTDCSDPIAKLNRNETYTITVTNSEGCSTSTTIELTVEKGGVYIPTAFSPNGDGENDTLFVRADPNTAINLIIYDRWGEIVFKTKDLKVGWDGTFNGKPMNNACFAYFLQAIFLDESVIEKHGFVTLIR